MKKMHLFLFLHISIFVPKYHAVLSVYVAATTAETNLEGKMETSLMSDSR